MLQKEKISKLKPDPNNPRTISDRDMNKLIDSILSFPQMMKYRPMVRNEKNQTIAGNMRLQALKKIIGMSSEGIMRRIVTLDNYEKMGSEQQAYIIKFFGDLMDSKEVYVLDASSLTPEQQKEFIIKDNTHFGAWDMDAIANEWDSHVLPDWGLNVNFEAMIPNEAAKDIVSENDRAEEGAPDKEDVANAAGGEGSGNGNKILSLEFSPEDYDSVMSEIKKRGGIPEGVIMGLLGIN